ncbi:MAG TPA: maleylacetoacetate isomerase [Caulobacteraceae bacterium]|nr:maleylacetoacetate isomerase [Caulobacteraceae bacterium]
MPQLRLHSYWRATAPFRVRIALRLKGLEFVYEPVNLLAGEQESAEYRVLSRQGLTPCLENNGDVLVQSLAIMEWLEETYRRPPLLPQDPVDRARVRAMAAIVACDVHPLNNLRVLKALAELGHPMGGPEQLAWGEKWIVDGFRALEPMVAAYGAGFAFGAEPTLADCCLVPQVWASSRFQVDLSPFPAIRAVYARSAEHPAFIGAHPDQQPDAPGRSATVGHASA